MKKENIKNYMSNFIIIIAMFSVLYGVLWLFTSNQFSDEDYQAINFIHEGRLEIEKKYKETGEYSKPRDANIKLAELGYSGDFKLKEYGGYTYQTILSSGFIFDEFLDPSYCINEKGEFGTFENWDCEL